jgi:hypothetical protein
MTLARSLSVLLAAAALAACSSAPPPPAPQPQAPGVAAPGGDVLPPQARSAQPPARPVNPMLQQ